MTARTNNRTFKLRDMAFLLTCKSDSHRVCGSGTKFLKVVQAIRIKKPGYKKPGQTSTKKLCDLRRPGGHSRFRGGRPMALRRRLSPGLPLSDVVDTIALKSVPSHYKKITMLPERNMKLLISK